MGPHDLDNAWKGTTYMWFPQITVQFIWLLYPGVILLATTAFLISTIAMNARSGIPLWKSKTSAMLFTGLTERLRLRAANHNRPSELDDFAEELKVKLEKTKEGWRLT